VTASERPATAAAVGRPIITFRNRIRIGDTPFRNRHLVKLGQPENLRFDLFDVKAVDRVDRR
jgi:hypothetical protein